MRLHGALCYAPIRMLCRDARRRLCEASGLSEDLLDRVVCVYLRKVPSSYSYLT